MQNLLDNFEEIFPAEFPVVFLHAHPDDESFLSGGLIQLLARKQRQVFIIYCAAAIVSGEPKTLTRQSEARAAAVLLNIPEPLFLNFCEPHYICEEPKPFSTVSIGAAVSELFTLINQITSGSKTTLISYDENGGYGNVDHKKVFELGKEFAKKHQPMVNQLLEVTIHRSRSNSWLEQNATKPLNYLPEIKYWSSSFGTPDSKIRYYYELTLNELEKKKLSLSTHKSQLDSAKFPLTLKPEDFKSWFGTEYLNDDDKQMYFAGERKFVVKNPPDLNDLMGKKIIQGYLPESTNDYQLRLRHCDSQYWYTEIKGLGLNKYSNDRPISAEEFNDLWPQTQNYRIEKIRYIIPYNEQHIDLDVFHGNQEGLIIAEIEGNDTGNKTGIPDWFDTEVTDDPNYTNYYLSKAHNNPDDN